MRRVTKAFMYERAWENRKSRCAIAQHGVRNEKRIST
jgi:hypothetical protein